MQQDYNRWAPGSSEADDEGSSTLSRQQSAYEAAYSHDDHEGTDIVRDRMRARRLRDRSHWEHMPRQPADGEAPQRYPSRFVENGMSASSNEPSLRTQAMLQAVRQNSQMSPRSRGHLQRFILDRERLSFEYDSRDRERSDSDTNSNHLSLSQRRHVQAQRNEQQSLRQARSLLADAQRRTNHLAEQMRSSGNFRPNQREASSALQQRPRPLPYTRTSSSEGVDLRRTPAVPAAHSPDNNASVENTLKYLESLRLCESQSEGLEAAIDTGFNLEELFPNHDAEFLIDIRCIPPPPDSSWLQVGSVLSGSQHAMPARALTFSVPPRPHSDRSRIRHPTLGITSARTPSPVRASTNTAPYLRLPATQAADFDDQWPVKVTIHGVDYKEMTLSGTMEACEVPDKTVPSKTSNITTYLEGEIIDFNKFTLETKNFQADTRTDGVYWRKLPPFKDLKDEETIVRCLLNKDWLKSYLMQNWILMRWKGVFQSLTKDRSLMRFLVRKALRNAFGGRIQPHHQRLLLRVFTKIGWTCRGSVL